MNTLEVRYRKLKQIAARAGETRGYVAGELRRIGERIGKTGKEIETDIRAGEPVGTLKESEAQESKRKWSVGFEAGLTSGKIPIGPYINLRLRKEVHTMLKANAAAAGMTMQKYLVAREGREALPMPDKEEGK